MNYYQLREYMRTLYVDAEGVKQYSKRVMVSDRGLNLEISFPTYKGRGDYKMELEHVAISHARIVTDIYRYIVELQHNRIDEAEKLSDLLLGIQREGTDFISEGFDSFSIYIGGLECNVNEFIEIIFWITGQEEINYPQEKGKKGVRLPFSRYQEAIIAGLTQTVSLEQVIRRTNSHGKNAILCMREIEFPDVGIISGNIIRNIALV